MNNFREVNENISKEWIEYREDVFETLTEENKKHLYTLKK